MTSIAVPAGRTARTGGQIHTFFALLARDMRVARRDFVSFAIRAIIQPVLFVFVFTFVLPKIGSHGGASPFSGSHAGAPSFSTILVPGLIATSILVQGLLAVTAPLIANRRIRCRTAKNGSATRTDAATHCAGVSPM